MSIGILALNRPKCLTSFVFTFPESNMVIQIEPFTRSQLNYISTCIRTDEPEAYLRSNFVNGFTIIEFDENNITFSTDIFGFGNYITIHRNKATDELLLREIHKVLLN